MSWLFSQKKLVPKVPFPQAQPFDEKALSFPSSLGAERIIEPDAVKAAAGLSVQRPSSRMERVVQPAPALSSALNASASFSSASPASRSAQSSSACAPIDTVPSHVFVKVEAYQQIIAELDSLKKGVGDMSEVQKKLESSEYFEEEDFDKMQRSLKSVHDNLGRIDKKIFK